MRAEIKQMDLLGGSPDGVKRGAVFSAPGFRTSLMRSWDETKEIGAFIGVNPGKADAERDDQTAKKMVGFARRWGWGAYIAYNLFEIVATNQEVLYTRILNDLPVGPDPIEPLTAVGHRTVCLSWGNPPSKLPAVWLSRIKRILFFLRTTKTRTVVAGLTNYGHPCHLSRYGYVDAPKAIHPDLVYPLVLG